MQLPKDTSPVYCRQSVNMGRAMPPAFSFRLGLLLVRGFLLLLECKRLVSNFKRITARIRRARTGKDPAGQLSTLLSRHAMVAFQLAVVRILLNNNEDAGKWYLTAAERFRRADWKTKAQESAADLGATVAAEIPALPPKEKSATALKPEIVPTAEALTEPAVLPATADEAGARRLNTVRAKGTRESGSPGRRRGRRGGREHQRPRGQCTTDSWPRRKPYRICRQETGSKWNHEFLPRRRRVRWKA